MIFCMFSICSFNSYLKKEKRPSRNTKKRKFCSSYLYSQSRVLFPPPGRHASHYRLLSFESAQSLLALFEQRALCTFFSLPPQASLHCCGLMVSSPGPCASSGGRMPEALFSVSRLESKGAKGRRIQRFLQCSQHQESTR